RPPRCADRRRRPARSHNRVQGRGRVRGMICRIDASDDLALLHVPYFASTNVAQFAEGPVRLGTEVAAFGFPLRGILADQLNMTTGVVSSLAGLGGNPKFIQFSAAVGPGNSGGPGIEVTGPGFGFVTNVLNRVGGANADDSYVPQLINFAVRHERALQFLTQHGVQAKTSSTTLPIEKAELAVLAGGYTSAITCYRQ